MKKIILILQALICVKAIESDTFVQQWNDFKTQFGKKYESSKEELQRMQIFINNFQKIAKHNELFKEGKVSFEMGMSKFGDMTPEESEENAPNMESESPKIPESKIIATLPRNSGTVPEKKNWVTDGAVTGVKEQAKCGCCWAFAISAAIEGQFAISTKKKVSFSVQQMLDCVGTRDGHANNCKQGYMLNALQYSIENDGIDTYQSYPYEAKVNKCRYNPDNKTVTVKDYRKLVSKDEKLMKDVVGTIGPIACDYYVVPEFRQFYKSGIYSNSKCRKDKINHSFLIVGYDKDEASGIEYWIIKNQYGKDWGMDGYAYIRRNTNECAISLECYYPII